MLKVKGIYRNSIVELLEPVDVPDATEVEVGFPQASEEEENLTEAQKSALAIIGLLNDLTPEQQQLFDEAIQRSRDF